MLRIAQANIPEDKPIKIAITYIYGVGNSLSSKILTKTGIDPNKRAKDLSTQEMNLLRKEIEENYKVEGDLRREKMMNIKRLKDIKCYRGTRHIRNLPVRGQKTKVNTRTVRGNLRRTIGSGRSKAPEKT
jgi:small subunit ribosomal protein S13